MGSTGIFSAPFHDGYGCMTQRGIKTATYHALRLLVEYASERKYFDVKTVDNNDVNTTLEVFVTIDEDESELVVSVILTY